MRFLLHIFLLTEEPEIRIRGDFLDVHLIFKKLGVDNGCDGADNLPYVGHRYRFIHVN
jgi:hypothetical protein